MKSDEFCRVPGTKGIYAIGDNAAVPHCKSGDPCPPTFLYALTQGLRAADNIIAELRGQPLRKYRFSNFGEVAQLGNTFGLVQFFGMPSSGFLASLLVRIVFFAFVPSWRCRLGLMADWTSAIALSPDVSQMKIARTDMIVPLRFAASQEIIRQGEPGSRFYIINSGKVEVVRRTGATEEVLATLGPGKYFGEVALLQIRTGQRPFERWRIRPCSASPARISQCWYSTFPSWSKPCRRLRASALAVHGSLDNHEQLMIRGVSHCFAFCGAALAQELTFDQAIQMALRSNRPVQNAVIEAAKFDDRKASVKSQFLPSAHIFAIGAQPVAPFDFTISRGEFGKDSGRGQIPESNVQLRDAGSPHRSRGGSVIQPLSAIPTIRKQLALIDVEKKLADEQTRLDRQTLVRDVRELYYGIQSVQSAVRAARESVRLSQEVVRVTSEYVEKRQVLDVDYLEAQVHLAKAMESVLDIGNQRETLKSKLNHEAWTRCPHRVHGARDPRSGGWQLARYASGSG